MENKTIFLAVILFVLLFSLSISFFVWKLGGGNNTLTAELAKLNPKKDTTDLVNAEKCTQLSKSETEWIITGCKDNIVVRLIFRPKGGYVMRVCGDWISGREVVQRAKNVLEIFGIDVNCDMNSIILLRTEDGVDIYDICGNEVYLSNGCIV
jgi:hypothetical protein